MLVAIHHGRVAGLFHALAEGHGVGVVLLGAQAVGACLVAVADRLLVEHDGVGKRDVKAAQAADDVLRLLGGLLGGDCLREEVHAHLDAGRIGTRDVGEEVVVEVQRALAVAAIARAHHGEIDAGGLDLRPVYLAVVLGDVDAGLGEQHAVLVVLVEAVVVLGEARPVDGVLRFLLLHGVAHARGDERGGHGGHHGGTYERGDELPAREGDLGRLRLPVGPVGRFARMAGRRALGRRGGGAARRSSRGPRPVRGHGVHDPRGARMRGGYGAHGTRGARMRGGNGAHGAGCMRVGGRHGPRGARSMLADGGRGMSGCMGRGGNRAHAAGSVGGTGGVGSRSLGSGAPGSRCRPRRHSVVRALGLMARMGRLPRLSKREMREQSALALVGLKLRGLAEGVHGVARRLLLVVVDRHERSFRGREVGRPSCTGIPERHHSPSQAQSPFLHVHEAGRKDVERRG